MDSCKHRVNSSMPFLLLHIVCWVVITSCTRLIISPFSTIIDLITGACVVTTSACRVNTAVFLLL